MQTSKDVSHLAIYSIDDAIPSTFLYEPKEYANLIEIEYVKAICVKVNFNVFKFVTVMRNLSLIFMPRIFLTKQPNNLIEILEIKNILE